MPDHMNYYNNNMEDYYNDKANIYKYQNENNYLITSEEIKIIIEKTLQNKSKITVPHSQNFTSNLMGAHNEVLISYALEVAKILGLSEFDFRKYLLTFKAEDGRLEYLGELGKKRLKIINDNNATTPDATIAGIVAVRERWHQKQVLIAGGKSKNLNLAKLAECIQKDVKFVILLAGTGTDELIKLLLDSKYINYKVHDNLSQCVADAIERSEEGDIVLFSPAFASFSHEFNNEYERNDKFVNFVDSYRFL